MCHGHRGGGGCDGKCGGHQWVAQSCQYWLKYYDYSRTKYKRQAYQFMVRKKAQVNSVVIHVWERFLECVTLKTQTKLKGRSTIVVSDAIRSCCRLFLFCVTKSSNAVDKRARALKRISTRASLRCGYTYDDQCNEDLHRKIAHLKLSTEVYFVKFFKQI